PRAPDAVQSRGESVTGARRRSGAPPRAFDLGGFPPLSRTARGGDPRLVGGRRTGFVAECFWPDVSESDIGALDRRIRQVIGGQSGHGAVRYLGATLLCDDEVVLCEFEASERAVREVAERAEVPFQRILH